MYLVRKFNLFLFSDRPHIHLPFFQRPVPRCSTADPRISGCIDTDMIRQPLIMPNGEGWTVTEDDNLTSIIKRWAKPEEIAASIAFLLGDECRMITRQEWRVDGGWLESDYVGGHEDYKHE
jgi:hypothetical protein